MSRKLTLENGQTYYTTPELYVYPAPWQVDYKKNFANKELRQKVLEELPYIININKAKKLEDYYYDYIDKLHNKYNKDIHENNSFLNNEEKFKLNKLNELKENAYNNYINSIGTEEFNNVDLTSATERLYNIWNSAGRPSISNKDSFVNLFYKNRANINPFQNHITAFNLEDIIEELAHPLQIKYGKRNKLYNQIVDGIETIYNEITGSRNHYENPNHYEYETHSIIAPELYDYIAEGIPTKYVKQRKSIED